MKEKDLIKIVLDERVSNREQIKHNAINSVSTTKYRGFNMKKRALITCVFLITVIMVSTFSIFTPQYSNSPAPQNAEGYQKLLSVIENFNNSQNSLNVNTVFGGLKGSDMIASTPEVAPNSSSNAIGNDYSTTNVQNVGVDEGDIVKVDGQYIYKINTKGCIIIEVNNGNMIIASEIAIDNYVPQELYLSGNKLIMIGGIYHEYSYNGITEIAPMMDYMMYINYSKTDIRIYDITSKSAPVLERQITVDGSYYTSRILESTNELLYIVNYYFNYGDEDKYIPKLEDNTINPDNPSPMPVENIYYYEDIASFSYLVMGKINLNNPQNDSEMSAFLGLNGTIYVSPENLYVAIYDYMSNYKTNVWGWVSYDDSVVPKTRIVKISLNDLVQKASTKINGTIKDRYSMDEYQGYLRIASSVSFTTQYNMIYVLKSDLKLAGKIDNIAPGESIYSVRFNGVKGSLVTFEQIDPYFNLDLSDPFNPTISKGLKEDGVSYYIHYLSDTNYTIGVGRNTRLITNPYGQWVQWSELKVSLYDNTSGEAVNIVTVYLPEEDSNWSGYSELFYNPKALLYNADRGLFAFTYESWSYSDIYYYNSMVQGLAVFKIDLDAANDEDKLVYRSTLSNLSGGGINIDNYNWDFYYNSYFSFINRGVQIGDYIYTVSDKFITSYNIDSLNKVDTINLYEKD